MIRAQERGAFNAVDAGTGQHRLDWMTRRHRIVHVDGLNVFRDSSYAHILSIIYGLSYWLQQQLKMPPIKKKVYIVREHVSTQHIEVQTNHGNPLQNVDLGEGYGNFKCGPDDE